MRGVQALYSIFGNFSLSLKIVQNKRFKKLRHKRLREDSWKASGGRNMRCFSGVLKGACLRQSSKRAMKEA